MPTLSADPQTLLVQLINLANGTNLTPNQIQFGAPQGLNLRADENWNPNTYIPVSAPPNSPYRGQAGFFYRRMYLSDIEPLSLIFVAPDVYPFTTLDILDEINAFYGTQIQPQDIINQTYNAPTDPLYLFFDPSSLCWVGACLIGGDKYTGPLPSPNTTGQLAPWQTGTPVDIPYDPIVEGPESVCSA